MSEIAEDLRERYAILMKQMRGSKAQRRYANPLRVWIERISRAEARVAELEAENKRLEEDLDKVMAERDEAEECAGELYSTVTGNDAEWSNCFGYDDAINEVHAYIKRLRECADAMAFSSFQSFPNAKEEAVREYLEAFPREEAKP